MSHILMPKAGKVSRDATIVRWYKSEGDAVHPGDLLCLADTEEGLVEVESAGEGVLQKIAVPAGRTVAMGEPLAALLAQGEKPASNDHQGKKGNMDSRAAHSSAPAGPVVPILMPQAGNSMEEGTILSWKVKPGDRVKVGDVLVEIETDKSSMEVEATEDGRISRLVAGEGQVVPVKQPIAFLAENDSDVDLYLGLPGGVPVSEQPAPPAAQGAAPDAAASGSVIPVVMPQAGNSMEEGTILKWLKQTGDRIAVGDLLVEIETDKSSMEVEATDAGRLARIVAAAGSVVPVKEPIAFLAENDADVDAYLAGNGASPATPAPAQAKAPAKPAPPSTTAPAVNPSSGRLKASPAARKAAAAKGIDLASLATGSGPGGRILSTDVSQAKATFARAAAASPAAPPAQDAVKVSVGQPQRRPMSRMRKAIGKALTASKQTVPHFYVRLTVDADPLHTYYRQAKESFKLSVNDVLVKACARVIQEFPAFRSRIEGDEIVEYPNSNIGIAVGIEDGLLVPVVLGVEQMPLSQLAGETRRCAETARGGKVENQGKGVFTISNMGMFGVEEFSAIINPPEAAILAIGAIRESVIVRDGMMRPGRVMTMTLSCDHRIVDGALGARFMARLKEVLEDPSQIV